MASLSPSPKMQFFTSNGVPLSGGKLYTYVAGGLVTPQTTYTDSTGSTPNTNPIILDSRGECSIWLTDGPLYAYKLTDSADVLIWTADNIGGLLSPASIHSATSKTAPVDADEFPIVDSAATFGLKKLTWANLKTASRSQLGLSSGTSNVSYNRLSGTVRCTAGVWDWINDANHRPTGFGVVTQPDAFTVRVAYLSPITKISTFVVGADDALQAQGLIAGADVGTTFANILMSAPLSVECTGAAAKVSCSSLFNATTSVTASGGAIVVTHSTAATNDTPSVIVKTPTFGTESNPPQIVTTYTATTVSIKCVDDLNGYVSYGGAAWSQALSNNVNAPISIAMDGTGNVRVTHEALLDNLMLPSVTGHAGIYIVQTVNIASTYFEVAFFDYAGTKITVPNTNMKFSYRRNAKVLSSIPATTSFLVKRGPCKVPVASVSDVAGNNLWISAEMEA